MDEYYIYNYYNNNNDEHQTDTCVENLYLDLLNMAIGDSMGIIGIS